MNTRPASLDQRPGVLALGRRIRVAPNGKHDRAACARRHRDTDQCPHFSTLDTCVFLVYIVAIAVYGIWIYWRKKRSSGKAIHDFFPADGSLMWWAIGASLIASNISAEQFIGMSGSGYRIGMAIAVYELFAAFLKLLMPIIVVLPGIAAYALDRSGTLATPCVRAANSIRARLSHPARPAPGRDQWPGLRRADGGRGGLAGRQGQQHRHHLHARHRRQALQPRGQRTEDGVDRRVSVVASMAIAVLLAPLMGIDKKGGFQYIQAYTGFVSPGILAMFLLGVYWRKTTAAAAMFATIGGLVFSVFLKFLPLAMDPSFLAPLGFAADNGAGVHESRSSTA